MQKNFSRKNRLKGVSAPSTPFTLAEFVERPLPLLSAAMPITRSLPDRLVRWFGNALQGEGRHLPRRRPGIDTLEPRLLLSADPVTVAASVTFGGDVTLRVSEVEYKEDPDTGESIKESRLQLVKENIATDTVLSSWHIRVVDGTKRIVQIDADDNVTSVYETISFNSSNGDNSILLDQSILSLSDGVQFSVTMGGTNDTITGPEVSAGLIWSIDQVSNGGANGKLSIMQATGDIENPEENDTSIDKRVTYDSGNRDYFLSFNSVEKIEAEATRDVVVDRRAATDTEWQMTWDSDSARLRQFTTSTAVNSATSTVLLRDTVLDIDGVEGFRTVNGGHLNLSNQNTGLGGIGASINAESGQLNLYEVADTGRINPLTVDVRGVTSYTGTYGSDIARAARGVSINMFTGDDKLHGNDDLLIWTVDSMANNGVLGEAEISLDYNLSATDGKTDAAIAAMTDDARGEWISLNQSSRFWGVDDIVGSDNGDRLILDYNRTVKVDVSGDEDEPELWITNSDGTGPLFTALSVEEVIASAAESTVFNVLDYRSFDDGSANVSIDMALETATGLALVRGFGELYTGGGNDQVVAVTTTRLISTAGGDDTITLAVVASGQTLSIDAGSGAADTLFGDVDAENAATEENALPRPIATTFTVNSVLPEGANGIATFTESDNYVYNKTTGDFDLKTTLPTPISTGGTINFEGFEIFTGQGSVDDADGLFLNILAPNKTNWYVTDVYEGTIKIMGLSPIGTLQYTGIARAGNLGTNTTAVPLNNFAISYGGDGSGANAYSTAVNTDLRVGRASGFSSFTGDVYKSLIQN
jgi:hypothetical protein